MRGSCRFERERVRQSSSQARERSESDAQEEKNQRAKWEVSWSTTMEVQSEAVVIVCQATKWVPEKVKWRTELYMGPTRD